MQDKKIPIVMICDQNFVMQTCVALTSLWKNKEESTVYDVYVMVQDCDEAAKEALRNMKRPGFTVHVIEKTVEEYQEIRQLAHVSRASLYKFDICDTIPDYDKLLYLDGDMIVRRDLSILYDTDLGDNYVAGVPHSLGIITGEKKLNGGLLLFNAAKIREEGLRDVFLRTRLALGDRKSMDQETFHIVFGNKKLYLQPKYNVMLDKVDYERKYYSLEAYNAFYQTEYRTRKEIIDSAVIVHFTGAIKPWIYKFAKCAKEWYGYYLDTFGTEKKLVLKGRTEYFCQVVQKNGFRGLYWLLKDWILEKIGELLGLYPDLSHGEWN